MTRIFKDIIGNTACITRRLGFPHRDAKNKIYGYKLTLSADYNGGDVYFVTIYPSEEEPGKWVARGDIWNGKKGSGITQAICSTCESVDDAMKALEELAEKYPNDKDLRIFIDDLKE